MTTPETNTSSTLSSAEADRRLDGLHVLSNVVFEFVRVKRATLVDGERETDGEHTVHLAFLALAYAAEHRPDLDLGRVVIDALIHDFVEVYAGDVPTFGASDKILEAKKAKEAEAFALLKEILADWPKLLEYVHSYEELDHPEARFIKTFDKLAPGFTHFANKGASLKEHGGFFTEADFLAEIDNVNQRMAPYSHEHPDLIIIRERLTTQIARTAFSDGNEQLKLW